MLKMAEQFINYHYLEEFLLWIYASCLFLPSCHFNSGVPSKGTRRDYW